MFVPIVFVFLWSTGFIFTKMGLPYAEPLGFLSVRFGSAAMILLVVQQFLPKTHTSISLVEIFHAAVAGILLQAVYLGGIFSGVAQGIGAGLSALIVGLQPLITVVLASIWLKEGLSFQKISGITLGLAGVALVISERGQLDGEISVLGLMFCIGSLLGITVGAVYQKRYCTNISLLPSVTVQYTASVAVLLPLAVLTETLQFDWQPCFIFSLGWLILVLSLGAVFILMWLIRRGEAGRVATLFYLVPPVVALEAWVLFDESLSFMLIAGTTLCIVGVAVVMLEQPRANKTHPEISHPGKN